MKFDYNYISQSIQSGIIPSTVNKILFKFIRSSSEELDEVDQTLFGPISLVEVGMVVQVLKIETLTF